MTIELVDLLDENVHENDRSRATGFVGQSSDIQWLRSFLSLEKIERNEVSGGFLFRATNEQVSTVTYYLDHENIGLEHHVDPYELPPFDTVKVLLSVYMDKVHGSFPILPRKLLEDQCSQYFSSLGQNSAPPLNTKWQAALNLVFAIGAKYSQLVKANWQANEQDHKIYRARAQRLAVNASTLERHPDLLQIQVMGLLAFYHLSDGHVNR